MRTLTAIAVAVWAGGCGGSPSHEAAPVGGEHEHEHEPGHVHEAPHGGLVLVLGDEFAHLELLHDAATGELSAWIFDAELERSLRVSMDHIRIRLEGSQEPLTLNPRANPLTGETVGDTSEFGGQFPELLRRERWSGTVLALAVGDRAFVGLDFVYPGEH